ncbi:MAG: hypothetical protein HKO57_17985, partial [Akkermansiaceae bacterium]|nr:hypothetical protein [Akkermansiaceae bacterium]
PPNRALAPGTAGYEYADHAWLANNTLWDRYYFSGLRDRAGVDRFLAGEGLPILPRARPHLPAGSSAESARQTLMAPHGYRSAAAHQLLRGSFNIHSTSVAAWKMLLCSLQDAEVPLTDPVSLAQYCGPALGTPFPRMLDGPSGRLAPGRTPSNQDRWTGYRDLTSGEIDRLAREIVRGIQRRGPFLSMSEFINRRLDGDPETTALAGVLEEAIGRAGLNADSASLVSRVVTRKKAEEFNYPNPAAAVGNTEEGSAAFLSQGDILSAIGASLTVRSDTFLVRAYGEARNAAGAVVESAVCEAVVQRIPDFIDPSDPVDASPHGGETALVSDVSRRFGRRFRMLSFRWVPPEEV